ncbi:MAG: hypothetical protein ACYST6_09315 [Planctomycetota bacterium]
METRKIGKQTVRVHHYNTVIVGAGAAGMNCAVHLCEFMTQKGVEDAQHRIAVVTGGLLLGASRMSGSDKQTYYKMGTSCDMADSAEDFAKTLTAAGAAMGIWHWQKRQARFANFIIWSRQAFPFRMILWAAISGTRPTTTLMKGPHRPALRQADI